MEEEDLIDDILTETSYYEGNASSETVTENGVTTSETEYDYDAEGNIVSEETASGIVEESTYTSYDDNGRVPGIGESTAASDRTVTYSSDGLITTIHDAGGKTQTEVQDGSGLTLSITDAAEGCASMQESYTYDSDGNLTKKILPDGSEIRYINDTLGRITVEKRYEYDGEGLTQTSEICRVGR